MERRSTKPDVKEPQENPRAAAVRTLLRNANVLRRLGSPAEAAEALTWEERLQERLREIEGEPKAA